MKISKQEQKYKDYLQINKRIKEVEKLLDEIPLIPLDEPFQKGWVVTIRLREDISKRRDAKEIEQLIDIGYAKEYITQSEKEVKLIRSGKKSYTYTFRKKKITKSLIPSRKRVNEKTYDALTEQLKSNFYLDTLDWAYVHRGVKTYLIHIPEYWISLKARPNMITHYRKKGGELEQEYAHLCDKAREYEIENFGGYKDYPKNNGRKQTKIAIRKFIKGEVDDVYFDKTPLEYGD